MKAICRKCLERDTAQRYATAWELADDLRRYLNGEPIQGRSVGRSERLLKWMRRRPAAAALAALVPALLVTLLILLIPRRQEEMPSKPIAPPEPPPTFTWDFTNGDLQGTIGQGTEIIAASRFGEPPLKGGSHLRFRQGGFSWMRATFTLPADLPTAGGRWLLKVYHLNTRADNGLQGFSPARIALNEQTVWEGDPDGPTETLVPGGVAWRNVERDISALIRPGENVLRWDHLHGATTNYWLKSFRVFWMPSAP